LDPVIANILVSLTMSTPFRTPTQARAVTTERTHTHRSYNEREVVIDINEELETDHFSESNTPLLTTVDSMNENKFPEVRGNEGKHALLRPEVLEVHQISLQTSATASETLLEAPVSTQPSSKAVVNVDNSELEVLCETSPDAEAESDTELESRQRTPKYSTEVERERETEIAQSIASSSSAQEEVEGYAEKEAHVEGDGEAAGYISSSSSAAEVAVEREKEGKEVQCTSPLSAAVVIEAEGQGEGEGEGKTDEVQHTPASSSAAEEEGLSERHVEIEVEEELRNVQRIASTPAAVDDADAEGDAETVQLMASSSHGAVDEAEGEEELVQSISSSSIAQEEVEGYAEKEAIEGAGEAAEYMLSSSPSAAAAAAAEAEWYAEGCADEDGGQVMASSPSAAAAAAAEAEWYAEGCADGEGGQVMASSPSAAAAAAAEAEWYADGEEAHCTASTTAVAYVYGGGEEEGEGGGEGDGQCKGAQRVTSPIAAGGGDASLTVPDVPIISDIIALPGSANVAIPGSTEILPVSLYEVNDVVDVESRVWPGMNKPGGRARIIRVHTVYPSGGKRSLQQ
jgi:hypothetical protein